MIDPNILDEFAKRLSEVVPQSARDLQQDIEKNMRAVVSSIFEKLNLVTREEFEIQEAVLSRTREKIEALQKQITEFEALLKEQEIE